MATATSTSPAAAVEVASPVGDDSTPKATGEQEATARKQRLLDELKAVEAAIARKKAKIRPQSQAQTAVHDT